MRDNRTSDSTPRPYHQLSCVSSRHAISAPVSLPRNSGSPGFHPNRRARVPDIGTGTDIALRSEIDADFQPEAGRPDGTAQSPRLVDKVERHLPTPAYGATNNGVEPRDDIAPREPGSEPAVPSRRSSEPDPTVSNARYRAAAVILNHSRWCSRRSCPASETAARRSWRGRTRIRTRAPAVAHHAPGHGLVAVQPGHDSEIRLEGVDIQRHTTCRPGARPALRITGAKPSAR